MATLDVSQWRTDPAIAAAVSQGFNLMKNLYRLMCKEFPWFGDWKIAYFTKEDLPGRIAMGWRQLKVTELPEGDDFQKKFNEAIESYRFSLRKEADSSLWFKDLSICVMPKRVWDEIKAATEEANRMRSEQMEAQFADRDVPHAETDAKTWKVINEPTEPQRKPGRPKKE